MAEPITDVEGLKQFIRDRTKETWDQRRGPYYLSFIGTEMNKLDVNYRDMITPFTLMQWALSTGFADIRIISHPTQRAKIGFVPSEVEFSFKDEMAIPHNHSESTNGIMSSIGTNDGRRGQALLTFVESLASLSDDSLQDFHIPAKALVQLLKS